MNKKALFLICCISFFSFFIAGIVNSNACMIPVYRYGLETWRPDDYRLIVFHKGVLSDKDRTLLDYLKQLKTKAYANFGVEDIDIASSIPVEFKDEKILKDTKQPLLAVKYPAHSRNYRGFVWSGTFIKDNINRVVFSPARKEIGKKLLANNAVVWVLIESGDKEKDLAAETKLSTLLKDLKSRLKLNHDLLQIAEVCRLDVNFDFSYVKISRKTPAEQVFIDMLMHLEPGLFELESQPMAFPVFVRGRALSPLVGKGIKEKFIKETCRFVIDACGCEIKADNPGVDLLMSVNWDAHLGRRWVDEEIPLVGTAPLAEFAESNTENVDVSIEKDKSIDVSTLKKNIEPEIKSDNVTRNIVITFAALFIIIAFLSAVLILKKRKR